MTQPSAFIQPPCDPVVDWWISHGLTYTRPVPCVRACDALVAQWRETHCELANSFRAAVMDGFVAGYRLGGLIDAN